MRDGGGFDSGLRFRFGIELGLDLGIGLGLRVKG